jgi:hypothetical protein
MQEVVEAQETELTSSPPPSIVPRPVQLKPLNVAAAVALAARQKLPDRQDTETKGEPPLAPSNVVHEPPEYLAAIPTSSTATQKAAVGQETEVSEWPPSMLAKVQALPSYLDADPPSSPATQSEGEMHETERKPCPGSTDLAGDHPPAAPAAELHSNPRAVSTRSEETRARPAFLCDRDGSTAARYHGSDRENKGR